MTSENIWQHCLHQLYQELPKQQFTTWIQPLTFQMDHTSCVLLAPNRFIREWVMNKYLARITELLALQGLNVSSMTVIISGDTPERENHSQAAMTNAVPRHAQTPPENAAFTGKNSGVSVSLPLVATTEAETQAIDVDTGFQNPPHPHLGIIDVKPPPLKHKQQETSTASENLYNTSTAGVFGDNPDLSAVLKKNNPHLDVTSGLSAPSADQFISESTTSLADVVKKQEAPVDLVEADTAKPEEKSASNIIAHNTFDTFVEGKSNQLARAAATQVAENPGGSYNPLFLYGGVGLGKTHLMHAVGNALQMQKPNAKVVYLHSERFVADMVKALQLNAINDFKRYYRSVDALLIDDIQFFANKERSQEEFFHTFNALIEGGQQIILTCDRYPREIKGLEERLKSRFGWGLTVAVEPPELETRVAILMKKAEQSNMELPRDAAFFIAQRIRSNVRELEGALRRVMAQAHFQGRKIDIELIKDSLRDLLSLQDRLVSIDNIQKTVAEYYKIKLADLLSKRRNRSVARPRQVAMSLAKELTSHSLPEIGDAFGGRDHTTVLHACRKIQELKESSTDIHEDVNNLLRILTT